MTIDFIVDCLNLKPTQKIDVCRVVTDLRMSRKEMVQSVVSWTNEFPNVKRCKQPTGSCSCNIVLSTRPSSKLITLRKTVCWRLSSVTSF